jgi:hypothetical protein
MPTLKRRVHRALNRKSRWPLVALVAIGAICFTLIALFAPADVRTALFGANGLIMALIAATLRSPLDEDDDKSE